jgi:aminomethyltransferase
MSEILKRTGLFQWHVDHGGRIVPFAGWEMPVQYPIGPLQEHEATRKAAGLFDIDHMGQMEVRGPEAETFLNHLVSYDVSQMKLFEAHYAILCYADGTCVDDLFIYKLPDFQTGGKLPYFFVAINASNREKDVTWTKIHARGYGVDIKDISDETYMLALQGPKAIAILNRLAEIDLNQTPRFSAVNTRLLGKINVLLGRTGYTGEDGFELFFAAEHALPVWEALLEAGAADGIKPVGLAARDSLRFEACMPLYGQEISDRLTPLQARLGFAISLEKDFIGRDALLKQKMEGVPTVQVGFEMMDAGVARHGYPVVVDNKMVGDVTSGMFSPTTGRYLGLAYVPRELSALGTEIGIDIRGKIKKAVVVKRPFYVPAYRRQG